MGPLPGPARLFWTGAFVGAVCLFALLFFPSMVAIPVYVLAPAGAALMLAGGREAAYVRLGLMGCVVAGLESAAWILALDEGRVVPRVIGAFASFVILGSVAALVCYVAGRVVFRRAAAR